LKERIQVNCFAKCFIYQAERMSHRQLLEPFTVETMNNALEYAGSIGELETQADFVSLTEAELYKRDALVAKLQRATGRPPGDVRLAASILGVEVPHVEVPLVEDEPNSFPCLLTVGGWNVLCLRVSSYIDRKTLV